MDSPLLRTVVQSAFLAARSVHQTLSFLHDDDDFQHQNELVRSRIYVKKIVHDSRFQIQIRERHKEWPLLFTKV